MRRHGLQAHEDRMFGAPALVTALQAPGDPEDLTLNESSRYVEALVVSLILGLFFRLSSVLGAVLMLLYYLPVLKFPYVAHGFLVDEHVIYGLALLYLAAGRAGRQFGLEEWCSRLPICARFPQYRRWLG